VAVTNGGALRDVPALRADHLVDLFLEQLREHAEADTDAQGQQPLLRRADQLAERLLHARRQWQLLGSDLVERYGLHGGSSFRSSTDRPPRSQPERTGRRDRRPTKFYELRDNLAPIALGRTRTALLLTSDRTEQRGRDGGRRDP
jgi:hypothetical protein